MVYNLFSLAGKGTGFGLAWETCRQKKVVTDKSGWSSRAHCLVLCTTLQIQVVFSSPLKRATATAETIKKVQSLAGHQQPEVQVLDDLTNRGMGEWEGRHALEVKFKI